MMKGSGRLTEDGKSSPPFLVYRAGRRHTLRSRPSIHDTGPSRREVTAHVAQLHRPHSQGSSPKVSSIPCYFSFQACFSRPGRRQSKPPPLLHVTTCPDRRPGTSTAVPPASLFPNHTPRPFSLRLLICPKFTRKTAHTHGPVATAKKKRDLPDVPPGGCSQLSLTVSSPRRQTHHHTPLSSRCLVCYPHGITLNTAKDRAGHCAIAAWDADLGYLIE